jgi:hypothetical protein
MPASLTTLDRFRVSDAMKVANAWALPPEGTAPWFDNVAFAAGVFSAAAIATPSCSMRVVGVPDGASTPPSILIPDRDNRLPPPLAARTRPEERGQARFFQFGHSGIGTPLTEKLRLAPFSPGKVADDLNRMKPWADRDVVRAQRFHDAR